MPVGSMTAAYPTVNNPNYFACIGGNQNSQNLFSSSVDDVLIAADALTASEISQLSFRKADAASGVVAWYDFNNASGTSIANRLGVYGAMTVIGPADSAIVSHILKPDYSRGCSIVGNSATATMNGLSLSLHTVETTDSTLSGYCYINSFSSVACPSSADDIIPGSGYRYDAIFGVNLRYMSGRLRIDTRGIAVPDGYQFHSLLERMEGTSNWVAIPAVFYYSASGLDSIIVDHVESCSQYSILLSSNQAGAFAVHCNGSAFSNTTVGIPYSSPYDSTSLRIYSSTMQLLQILNVPTGSTCVEVTVPANGKYYANLSSTTGEFQRSVSPTDSFYVAENLINDITMAYHIDNDVITIDASCSTMPIQGIRIIPDMSGNRLFSDDHVYEYTGPVSIADLDMVSGPYLIRVEYLFAPGLKALQDVPVEVAGVWLPSEIFLVSGREYRIYWNSIMLLQDISNLSISVNTMIPHEIFPDYLALTPDTSAYPDSTEICLSITDASSCNTYHVNSMLKIAPWDAGVDDTISLLCIGDSMTQPWLYPQYLYSDLSRVGNPEFTMLGGNTYASPYGLVHSQAAPGKTWSWYVSDEASPFTFTGTEGTLVLDFPQYLSTMGYSTPDIITIYLGINGDYGITAINRSSIDYSSITYCLDRYYFLPAYTLLDHLISACPSTRIGVSLITSGSMLPPYTESNWHRVSRYLNQRIEAELHQRYGSRISFITGDLYLNPLADIADNVHTNAQGSAHFAESFYCWYKQQFMEMDNVGVFAPESPNNLLISTDSDSIQLSWAPVTSDIEGNAIVPDGYMVYYGTSPESQPEMVFCTDCSCSIPATSLGATMGFFTVKAVIRGHSR
jgi:hypothetical protein